MAGLRLLWVGTMQTHRETLSCSGASYENGASVSTQCVWDRS